MARTKKPASSGPIDIRRLSPDQACLILNATAFGPVVDADRIRSDIASGAPSSADGSLDLIAYTAWLIGRMED